MDMITESEKEVLIKKNEAKRRYETKQGKKQEKKIMNEAFLYLYVSQRRYKKNMIRQKFFALFFLHHGKIERESKRKKTSEMMNRKILASLFRWVRSFPHKNETYY
jgi:hypothetical protein